MYIYLKNLKNKTEHIKKNSILRPNEFRISLRNNLKQSATSLSRRAFSYKDTKQTTRHLLKIQNHFELNFVFDNFQCQLWAWKNGSHL